MTTSVCAPRLDSLEEQETAVVDTWTPERHEEKQLCKLRNIYSGVLKTHSFYDAAVGVTSGRLSSWPLTCWPLGQRMMKTDLSVNMGKDVEGREMDVRARPDPNFDCCTHRWGA